MQIAETTVVPRGRARVHQVDAVGCALPRGVRLSARPPGWTPVTGAWKPNLVLYEWAAIVINLLTGSPQYKLAGMYIEYENEADDVTPAIPPDLSRDADQGVAYYNALSSSANRDYLRVPLIAATISSSDATRFPRGNLGTFFAQTTGVAGVWGKPFAAASNSRVFGAALVATPDWADATQDLVFSRFYFSASDQQVKLAASQIGIEWEIELQ